MSHEPMTEDELSAIEWRNKAIGGTPSACDVPALLAEVRRLRDADAQPREREPEPGELVRCCSHLIGDCELRPDGWHNSKRWHCRCCGISWHWTHAAPSTRVIPASPTPEIPEEQKP